MMKQEKPWRTQQQVNGVDGEAVALEAYVVVVDMSLESMQVVNTVVERSQAPTVDPVVVERRDRHWDS